MPKASSDRRAFDTSTRSRHSRAPSEKDQVYGRSTRHGVHCRFRSRRQAPSSPLAPASGMTGHTTYGDSLGSRRANPCGRCRTGSPWSGSSHALTMATTVRIRMPETFGIVWAAIVGRATPSQLPPSRRIVSVRKEGLLGCVWGSPGSRNYIQGRPPGGWVPWSPLPEERFQPRSVPGTGVRESLIHSSVVRERSDGESSAHAIVGWFAGVAVRCSRILLHLAPTWQFLTGVSVSGGPRRSCWQGGNEWRRWAVLRNGV